MCRLGFVWLLVPLEYCRSRWWQRSQLCRSGNTISQTIHCWRGLQRLTTETLAKVGGRSRSFAVCAVLLWWDPRVLLLLFWVCLQMSLFEVRRVRRWTDPFKGSVHFLRILTRSCYGHIQFEHLEIIRIFRFNHSEQNMSLFTNYDVIKTAVFVVCRIHIALITGRT